MEEDKTEEKQCPVISGSSNKNETSLLLSYQFIYLFNGICYFFRRSRCDLLMLAYYF